MNFMVPPAAQRDAVRLWLRACVVALVLAVVVGGITRLSESGLSITEWKPVSGIFPPLSAEAWNTAYQDFLRIPQAQTVHRGITLGGFKLIYWWEWFHRMLARGVGFVFAVPYIVLLIRRRIPDGYRARLAALPLLTAAQGALGWYMVQSGLAVRSSVSAYRLTAHLALALAILVIAVWTHAELGPHASARQASRSWRVAIASAVGLTVVTMLSGAFVAGLRAGKIYNTFPLMGGALVPTGYRTAGLSWWSNAFENPAAAQFHHRLLAMATALTALLLLMRARSANEAIGVMTQRAVRAYGSAVLLQAALGITTLLLAVPLVFGVAHQLVGVLTLAAGTVAAQRAWGTRHERRRSPWLMTSNTAPVA